MDSLKFNSYASILPKSSIVEKFVNNLPKTSLTESKIFWCFQSIFFVEVDKNGK